MARYSTKINREQREARRKQERRNRMLRWGGLGLLALVVVGGLIWFLTRPSNASADPVTTVSGSLSRDHIPAGTDPGPYETDPPTGGHHFPTTFNPGFYTEQDVAGMPKFPQGYLVHDLEHGYVIYWYNCSATPAVDCAKLQDTIKQVIQENNSYKVIGFPWPAQKEPLVITSWGRIQRLSTIDQNAMRAFYKNYVNKGPEQTAN